MNQPPKFVPHLPSLCAAILFAARHKASAAVPDNPAVSRLVDRIKIETDLEKGAASVLMDPHLYNFFVNAPLNFSWGDVVLKDVPLPHNQMLLFGFSLGRRSSLVLANGTQPNMEADPVELAKLKLVLG